MSTTVQLPEKATCTKGHYSGAAKLHSWLQWSGAYWLWTILGVVVVWVTAVAVLSFLGHCCCCSIIPFKVVLTRSTIAWVILSGTLSWYSNIFYDPVSIQYVTHILWPCVGTACNTHSMTLCQYSMYCNTHSMTLCWYSNTQLLPQAPGRPGVTAALCVVTSSMPPVLLHLQCPLCCYMFNTLCVVTCNSCRLWPVRGLLRHVRCPLCCYM